MFNKKLKGFSLQALAPLAIAFVVIAFAVSLGGTLLESQTEDLCPSGSTWGNWNAATSTCGLNGVSGTYYGCCKTIGAGAKNCSAWNYNAASNASMYGISSMVTLGEWLPTLALVVIAAVIIGVLVMYLGRAGGESA